MADLNTLLLASLIVEEGRVIRRELDALRKDMDEAMQRLSHPLPEPIDFTNEVRKRADTARRQAKAAMEKRIARGGNDVA